MSVTSEMYRQMFFTNFVKPSDQSSFPVSDGRAHRDANSMGSAMAYGNRVAAENTAAANATQVRANAPGKASKSAWDFGLSAVQGAVGLGLSAGADIISAGLNYDLGRKNVQLGYDQLAFKGKELEFSKEQFGFTKEMVGKEWKAAQAAGLFSPSQFTTVATGSSGAFGFSRGTSAALNVAQRTRPGSAWAMAL